MNITIRSDQAIRLLMYCSLSGDRHATVGEIASACGASANHLAKIANSLVHLGVLSATRGRKGGLRLARSPEEINVGMVLRHMEAPTALTVCQAARSLREPCPLPSVCALPQALQAAREAFFAVLDEYTLSDMIADAPAMRRILHLPA